ncbi:MAG: hypothetical protein QXL94_08675 [Candidatus Parvarchaeum sp.]
MNVPNGVLWYAPITLKYYYNLVEPHVEVSSMDNLTTTYTTTNSSLLSSSYQQMLLMPINWALSTTMNSTRSNVIFFDSNGNLLNSWLENVKGIATGGTTALYWVKMAGFASNATTQQFTFASTTQNKQNLITVYTTTYSTTSATVYSTTIYAGTLNKNNYIFNNVGTTGCNYLYQYGVGGVDNGANVFNYYGGFEVEEIPESWMMMFLFKPEFQPGGGVMISSLGGWQGYITSYQTHIPETLELFFYSLNGQTACVGVVESRTMGISSYPIDLATNSYNIPVGNFAPLVLTTPQSGFIQFEYNTGNWYNGTNYFGQWCIQSSNMGDQYCAGYAFNATPYVMSLNILSNKLQGQSNYGNTNMTSQSSRQTPGIPLMEVPVNGLTGFLDFGNFSGSNTTIYWVRSREYVQTQPTATFGVVQKNITQQTVTVSLTSELGVEG